MFDFEKLEVYKKIRETNRMIYPKLAELSEKDPDLAFQLRDSILKVVLNLVEGTGKYSTDDKKANYGKSRSALFEAVALYQLALDQEFIEEEEYLFFYDRFEQVSKMMLGMIRTKPHHERNIEFRDDYVDDLQ
jgi:four helix bundle protein